MKRHALFTESDSDDPENAVSHSARDEPDMQEPGWEHSRQAMSTLFAANDTLTHVKTATTGQVDSSSVEHLFRYGGSDGGSRPRLQRAVLQEAVPPETFETVMQERVQAYHGDTYMGSCTAAICVTRSTPPSSAALSSPSPHASSPPLLMVLRQPTSPSPSPPPSPAVLCRLSLTLDLAISLSDENSQYVHVLDATQAPSNADQRHARRETAPTETPWWSLMFPSTVTAATFFVTCLVAARRAAAVPATASFPGGAEDWEGGGRWEVLWNGTVRDEQEAAVMSSSSVLERSVEVRCTAWRITETAPYRLGMVLCDDYLEDAVPSMPALAPVWRKVQQTAASCRATSRGCRQVLLVAAGAEGVKDGASTRDRSQMVVYVAIRLVAGSASVDDVARTAPLALPAPPMAPHAQLAEALLHALSLSSATPAMTATHTRHGSGSGASARPTALSTDESLAFLRERVEALHDKLGRLDLDARLEARNTDLVKQVKQLMGLAPNRPVEIEDAMKDRDALLAAVERHKAAAQEATRNYERALESIGRYAEQVRALNVDLLTQKEAATAREGELHERHRLLLLEARTRHQSELETHVQEAYEKGVAEGMRRGRLQAYEAHLDANADASASTGGSVAVGMRRRLQAAEEAAAHAKLAAEEAKLRHEQDRRTLRAEIAVLQQLCEKLKQQAGDPQIPDESASAQVKRLKRALNAVYTSVEQKVFARVDALKTTTSAGSAAPPLSPEEFLTLLVSVVKAESKVFTGEIQAAADQRQRENTLLRQLMDERRATARLAAATGGPPQPPVTGNLTPALSSTESGSIIPPPRGPNSAEDDAARTAASAAMPSHPSAVGRTGLPPFPPSFPAHSSAEGAATTMSLTCSTATTTPRPTTVTPRASTWSQPTTGASPEPLSPSVPSPPLASADATPQRPPLSETVRMRDAEHASEEDAAHSFDASPPFRPSPLGQDNSAVKTDWLSFTQPPPPQQPTSWTMLTPDVRPPSFSPDGSTSSQPPQDAVHSLWSDETQTERAGAPDEDVDSFTPPRRPAIQLTP